MIEIRPARPEEFPAVLSPIMHYFGRSPGPEFAERFGPMLPADRIHVAFEDGEIVGSGGAFPFEIGVPGGLARAAGTTLVGVLPTHRRRGILRGLMRAQLDDVRERGEPLAYLWASQDAIYGRFGFGVASFTGTIDLPGERIAFWRDFEPAGRIRLLDVDEALEAFPPLQRRAAEQHPGMFVRTPEWWQNRRLADPEPGREGGGEMNRAILELDGEAAAYALYRLHFSADRGIPTGFTSVIEAVGISPVATLEIWRYLLEIDWMASIRAHLLPLDHELLLLVREPRRLRLNYRDGLWVRVVDVEAAMNARTFGAGEPVVIELADEFCAWNQGVWELGPDGAARSSAAPELRLDAPALGSAYLGGFTFAQLARAGRLEELAEGALARADDLFRTDRYPWCPEIF
ncbi:MAG TPA: GNAT family N-acetyltransferase [Gaiellaceae bacterium]|nr:GNAT family N-acetyltransferase [Gaiellaceae bacterium]